ncbi:hypothetical protein ACJX0J_013044, partial [Zea mays]
MLQAYITSTCSKRFHVFIYILHIYCCIMKRILFTFSQQNNSVIFLHLDIVLIWDILLNCIASQFVSIFVNDRYFRDLRRSMPILVKGLEQSRVGIFFCFHLSCITSYPFLNFFFFYRYMHATSLGGGGGQQLIDFIFFLLLFTISACACALLFFARIKNLFGMYNI